MCCAETLSFAEAARTAIPASHLRKYSDFDQNTVADARKPLGRSGRIIALPWGNEDTQQLIDILGKYKVPATFFVVGEWVDKYPESVKALHEAGHEIMNHSNTHAHYPQLTADEVVADLNACNDKIEAVTGVRPTLVRLPYGDYDDRSINAVRSIGMEPIQWDVDVSHTASSACGARV